mgnify:CR=1 FL=1
MDKEILELLKGMAENINSLTMEVRELKEGQEKTNTRLDKIEEGQEELKIEVKSIEKKIDTLYNAVAEAKEDITEIKNKVDKLEDVTMTNCYDIASLRKVK